MEKCNRYTCHDWDDSEYNGCLAYANIYECDKFNEYSIDNPPNVCEAPSSAERSAHPVLGDVLADFDSIIVSETENFIKFDKMQFHIMIRKYFA